MKLFVTVKAGAKINKVERMDDTHCRVSVKAPPKEGRANEAVIELLSEYFSKPKSHFSIRSGLKGKHKVVETV